ncbi:hypothetical protein [Aquisalimonas sp.]|uniref:alpha/beta hydrolase family protein n=1 Tax=Aquisalimonas sp. TaxID=1872621 RepID=UPI0025BCFBCC|nr:hypothetical protein [Aquisalimonas sp.]
MKPLVRRCLLILVLGLLVLTLTGCASVHRGYESMLLLRDVQAGAEDSRLKRVTEDPTRSTVAYEIADREHVADIYRPAGREPRGTLVLIHGFTEHGRRDPRMVEFATSMARSGFVVVAPDVQGPKTFAVSLDDARDIGDTLRYLITEAEDRTEPPIGLMAFSFAAGPTLIAAKDSAVAKDIGFVIAVGGYYDIQDAISYVTTGVDPISGREAAVPEPRQEGKWVVLLSQLDRIDNDEDRELLREIAELRLQDPWRSVEDAAAQLGEEGRPVYELITNTDPERVSAHIQALPEQIREELVGLDLAQRDLSQLHAELILVHGTDDDVIPIGHSEQLKKALGEEQAQLFPAAGLHHVDVSPGLRGGWQLWRVARLVFRIADEE